MGGQQSWDTTEGSEKLGPSGGGGGGKTMFVDSQSNSGMN